MKETKEEVIYDDYDFDEQEEEEYWNHREAMDGLYNAWELAGF